MFRDLARGIYPKNDVVYARRDKDRRKRGTGIIMLLNIWSATPGYETGLHGCQFHTQEQREEEKERERLQYCSRPTGKRATQGSSRGGNSWCSQELIHTTKREPDTTYQALEGAINQSINTTMLDNKKE